MIKFCLGILIGLTAFRYWLFFRAPISPFEAYLHMCMRRMDLAFFDGPAGSAMLVYWGNKLFANDLFALRWAAPLFAIFATVVIYILGKKLYSESAGLVSALLVNVLPNFQIASIQADGTLPGLAFWLLGILCMWEAWKTQKWGWWIISGLAFALGLQFSYWVLLALPSCLLCIVGRRVYFSSFSLFGFGILILFCLLGLIGPITWNIRQDWISFSGWTWQSLFELTDIKTEALLRFVNKTSLPGVCLVAISLFLCFQNARQGLRARFLAAFVIPPLVAILLLMLHDEQGPLLFAVVPLFVWLGAWWWQSTSPLLSWSTAAICVLAAYCSMVSLGASPFSAEKGLQKAALTVQKIAQTEKAIFSPQLGRMFFIAETPSILAEFEYVFDQLSARRKSNGSDEIFLRESQDISNQFRLWPSYADFSATSRSSDPLFTEQQGVNPYVGRSALYITSEIDALPQAISGAFEKILPLYILQIRRKGQVFRQLKIYLCCNYQTLPL